MGLRSLYDEWMGTLRKQTGMILGIESSCDETAAAVVLAGGEVLVASC